MTDFGLSASGLTIKRLADDVLPEYQAGFQSIYGENVDLDPSGPIGQFIGLIGESVSLIWELLEKIYGSQYLNSAEDASLDRVVALAGFKRLPATRTTVVWALVGTPGTIVPIGSTVKVTSTGAIFETLSTVTIGTDPSVIGRALETGPIRALSTPPTAWEIVSPVAGWTGVTNAADAKEGRNVESNFGLRVRYMQGFRTAPASAQDAVLASILRIGIDTANPVTEAIVIANEEVDPDADGRPGKSFETVVEGGEDQTIVDVLWATKPLGIKAYGSEPGVAIDSLGAPHAIGWSRPTELAVYVRVRYSLPRLDDDPGDVEIFPITGEVQIRDAILAYGIASLAKMGRSVYGDRVAQRVEVPGMASLRISVGLSADPSGDSPVIVPRTARALLDSSRITFERVTP